MYKDRKPKKKDRLQQLAPTLSVTAYSRFPIKLGALCTRHYANDHVRTSCDANITLALHSWPCLDVAWAET